MSDGGDGLKQLEQPAGPGFFSCVFSEQDPPAGIYAAWAEFADGPSAAAAPNTNFLKGVRWAPDGSCCLTVTDDNWLRVFDLPQDALQLEPGAPGGDAGNVAVDTDTAAGSDWRSGLQVAAGETVYDYAWFSGMSATDPVSCCFASTSRGQPVKLWDACSGGLRATYRAYDDADEITAAASLAFSPDGSSLVAGYAKALRVFAVARPGRDCRVVHTYRKRQDGSMAGIVSCLAFCPVHNDLMAAGTYGRVIGVFDARSQEQQLLLEGHAGGVTQVAFSPDGNFLYSGARRDGQLHCWDVRSTGQALYSLARDSAATNQRIGFSIEPCGRHLATGGSDGRVQVFDLRDGRQVYCLAAAADTVNGVEFSPCLSLLVTASGHRRYPLMPGAEDADGGAGSSSSSGSRKRPADSAADGVVPDATAGLEISSYRRGGLCNSLRLWRLQSVWLAAEAADDGQQPGGHAQAPGDAC